MIRALVRAALVPLAVASAPPALAQEPEEEDRNSLTVGLGAAWRPTYDGSDDYEIGPIGALFGKVAGFGFATRGTGLTVDLIRDSRDDPIQFDFGPLAYVRLDRTGGIDDVQVRALGEIDTAIELGAYAGVKKNRVLHDYDSLGVRLSWQKDVTGTHGSSLLTPSIEYETPLSETTIVSLSAAMEHAGDGYARTYYGVTPAGSLASGLPVFAADGGWKSTRLTLFGGQLLTGTLRDPGWSLFGLLGYSRLRGDFRRSPAVVIAGDPDQYFAALGVGYTF